MLDKETMSNLNITGKNILQNDITYSVTQHYSPNSNEFINILVNSNLNDENIIK